MRFFVTATDTDAGKTFVSSALLAAARSNGQRSIGFKPIESGAPNSPAAGLDAQQLAKAAQHKPEFLFSFREPLSPHYAAQLEAKEIHFPPILDRATELQKNCDFFLCEGAGGLLVPLGGGKNIADLAKALKLPVILVVANKLGCINHTLLSVEALKTRQIPLAAIVLNDCKKPQNNSDDRSPTSNLELLKAEVDEAIYSFPYSESAEQCQQTATQIYNQLRKKKSTKF